MQQFPYPEHLASNTQETTGLAECCWLPMPIVRHKFKRSWDLETVLRHFPTALLVLAPGHLCTVCFLTYFNLHSLKVLADFHSVVSDGVSPIVPKWHLFLNAFRVLSISGAPLPTKSSTWIPQIPNSIPFLLKVYRQGSSWEQNILTSSSSLDSPRYQVLGASARPHAAFSDPAECNTHKPGQAIANLGCSEALHAVSKGAELELIAPLP